MKIEGLKIDDLAKQLGLEKFVSHKPSCHALHQNDQERGALAAHGVVTALLRLYSASDPARYYASQQLRETVAAIDEQLTAGSKVGNGLKVLRIALADAYQGLQQTFQGEHTLPKKVKALGNLPACPEVTPVGNGADTATEDAEQPDEE